MRHRRFTNESENAGLSATVSLRALIIFAPMEGSFAQWGTSPHLKLTRIRCSACSLTAYTCWVGGMFQLGGSASVRCSSMSNNWLSPSALNEAENLPHMCSPYRVTIGVSVAGG